MKFKLLYEDNHIIAVYKPSGVLVQGDSTKDASLMDDVKKYLKDKYNKPGNVFLAPIHRIDRPVSGIVLYAKTSKGASRISAQFRDREIEKTYHAIVMGKMEKSEGEIVNYITKVSYFAQAFVDGAKMAEGPVNSAIGDKPKKAELRYRVIKSNDKYSLLEIKPKTGRFHQIRIQLSAAGHPILGDRKYGAPFGLKDRSIALCATSVRFKMATKEDCKVISIDIPDNWHAYINFQPLTN